MARIIILGWNVAFGIPHPKIEYLFSCGTILSVNKPDKSDQNIKNPGIIYNTLPANAYVLTVSATVNFIKQVSKSGIKLFKKNYFSFFGSTHSASFFHQGKIHFLQK